MNAIDRAKNIILQPTAEWQVIDQENGEPKPIYFTYLLYLLAIPAVAGFIGHSIVGISVPFMNVTIRTPFIDGIVQMVMSYALGAAALYVAALVIDQLAPNFQGERSVNRAFELVAYSATVSLAASVLMILPSLTPLVALAGFYGLYTFYLGVPVMMKCPKEKALPYTVVVLVMAVVVGFIFAIISMLFTPSARLSGAGVPASSASITLNTPDGKLTLDTAKLEAMGKQMEAAGKRMDAAQRSGDAQAMAQAAQAQMGSAVGAMVAATGANTTRAQMTEAELKALIPAQLGGLPRASLETSSAGVAGLTMQNLSARFAEGSKSIQIQVMDNSAAAGLSGLAALASVQGDKETATSRERMYREGNRTVKEFAAKDGTRASLTYMLANGLIIESSSEGVALPALKSAVDGALLAKLEARK